jgi:hypothetical protein
VVDRYDRWCLFYDLEILSSPSQGPAYDLVGLVPLLQHRIERNLSVKTIDRDRRILRIAQARALDVGGAPCLSMVMTLGNKTAADPSFIDFDVGTARDADRQPHEAKGASAHCILRTTTTPGHPGRYLMMLEQTTGLGRTTVERLLNSEFATIASDRGDNFISPATGRPVSVRPVAHMSGHKSNQMEEALRTGTFAPIELIDSTPDHTFDEPGVFRPKRRMLRVELVAPPGERRAALEVLSARAREAGWRPAGATRNSDSEIDTDLDDIGEAMFTKRELIHVEAGMSECSHTLRGDFITAMAERFS